METFPIRQRIPSAADRLPKRPNSALGHLPGPHGNWWTGHAARFVRNDAAYVTDMTRRYGRLFRMPAPFGRSLVVMTGAAANRRVLGHPGRIISNHNGYAQARLFGESIVTRDFEDHAELRKLIAPAFAKPALRRYADLINELIAAHFENLHPRKPQNLDMFPFAKGIALDLAAAAFAGMTLGADGERMKIALAAILEMASTRFPIRFPGGAYDRGIRGRKFAESYFASEVTTRRSGDGQDFLSLLCRAENDRGERLGPSEIVDNIIGAMIAGHDTTTVTLSALAYEFARHPDWQDTIREDCRRALRDSPNGTLSFDSAANLDRIEWSAKETLRLYSPIRYVQRRVVQEFEFEGHRIPKNATLLLSLHHTHHNSDYFESPESFRPDRFEPNQSRKQMDPDAWAPFGKGPHVCLGIGFAMLEIRSFFASLLTQYRLDLPEAYTLRVEGLPISMPRNGVPIRLTPLN